MGIGAVERFQTKDYPPVHSKPPGNSCFLPTIKQSQDFCEPYACCGTGKQVETCETLDLK